MHELNEPQARAVAHASGPLLVFAGAGSGKTRVITYRVASLLAEHRVAPYRILAVTFTNKAAGEMRHRLEQLAGPEVTRDLWVGTFHSMCAKLLRRYHDEVGLSRDFVIYDDSDQKAVVARIIKELGLDDEMYPPKLVLSRIHAEKREGRGPNDVKLSHLFDVKMLGIYERYQQALLRASAVDFEDLIVHVMRLAEDPLSPAGEDLRNRFRHVLVDEFQDTNTTQYRLVRAIAAKERNLCVVGDDDQSIYRWRGANIRNIRGFRRDFPDATVVKLEQNYRSTGNIVRAALGVIQPSRDREPKRLWTEALPGDPVHVVAVRDERDEAAQVVRLIQSEVARGVDPSAMAVFYRVHAQSRVLEEALRAENLPYQVVGGMKFFERAEVKNLLSYLRLIDNPRSDADLVRVINAPARGIGDKTVDRLLELATARGTTAWAAIPAALAGDALGTGPKKKVETFHQLIDGLRVEARDLSPHDLAARVLEATGYRAALRTEDSAEADARLENLEELLGSIAEFEEDQSDAGEKPTLASYLERVSLVTDVDSMKDAPKVALMTAHSAKGLEFTTVMLIGMEEEIFPYKGLGADEIDELEEERRLAYVAVTRARERLYVYHATMRTLFGQTRYLMPSRFLRDLPPEVVVREGGTGSSGTASQYRGWSGAASAAPSTRARGPAPAPARRLERGERVVDTDAFDDLPADSSVRMRPGDRVFHRRFGRGVVERVEHGVAPAVVARFPGFGSKKILAEYLEEP